MRTDPSVRAGVVVAKQAADLHTSTVDQAAAAHYLAAGRLDAAVDRSIADGVTYAPYAPYCHCRTVAWSFRCRRRPL